MAVIGLLFNMVIGVLFSWSVYAQKLTRSLSEGGYGWSHTMAILPYTITILVRAFCMYPTGRLQITLGPRITAWIGVLCLGGGFFLASLSSPASNLFMILGFGLLGGLGVGFCYSAILPVVIKWFPGNMVGRASGMVMFGMAIGTIYVSPISNYLLNTYGIAATLRILATYIMICGGFLALFLENPPSEEQASESSATPSQRQFSTKEMLANPLFYINWFQFFTLACVGLMLTGHLAQIVSFQSSGMLQRSYMMVVLLAIFNSFGRPFAGILFDLYGKEKTLVLITLSSLLMVCLLNFAHTLPIFLIIIIVMGLNYGSCISLFPSITADLWGKQNFSANYGIMYTAWGIAGIIGPNIASLSIDRFQTYSWGYTFFVILFIISLILSVVKSKVLYNYSILR